MPRGIPNPKNESEIDDMGTRSAPVMPRTTAGVNNTQTNYQPSVDRNNIDQALQPTGPKGTVAGLPGVQEEADEVVTPKQRMFPVLLKKGYRPETDECYGMRDDGQMGSKPVFTDLTINKIQAGYKVFLPVEEAKRVIAKGIGERADAIE